MNTVKVLKENMLFKGAEERIINILASIAETVSVPAETVIFAEGTPADALFVIVSGSVDVMKDTAEGKEVLIGELGAGDVLGILSLFHKENGDGNRAVTVKAKVPVELITITKDSFNKLVNNNIHAAYQVLLNITQYFVHSFNNPESLKEIIK